MIIEGNKAIAVYMGAEWELLNKHDLYRLPGKAAVRDYELLYHVSWNCLNSVVEKIEQLGYDSAIEKTGNAYRCYFSKGSPQGDAGEKFRVVAEGDSDVSKIEAVWRAVEQFVRWHP